MSAIEFNSETTSLNEKSVSVPKTLRELIQDPGQLDRVERLLQAMQGLTVSLTIDGVTRNFPVQFGENNALIDIRWS